MDTAREMKIVYGTDEQPQLVICATCQHDIKACSCPLPPDAPPIKKNAGKPRWYLVPWEALEIVVRVMEFGMRKYRANNWRGLEPRTAYVECRDSAMRHVVADMDGELYDPESGLPHLAHAVCQLLFCLWFALKAQGKAKWKETNVG